MELCRLTDAELLAERIAAYKSKDLDRAIECHREYMRRHNIARVVLTSTAAMVREAKS